MRTRRADAAEHAQADEAAVTAWPRIVRPYDRVLTCDPNPGAALDHAVAVVEAEGPHLRSASWSPCRWVATVGCDGLATYPPPTSAPGR